MTAYYAPHNMRILECSKPGNLIELIEQQRNVEHRTTTGKTIHSATTLLRLNHDEPTFQTSSTVPPWHPEQLYRAKIRAEALVWQLSGVKSEAFPAGSVGTLWGKPWRFVSGGSWHPLRCVGELGKTVTEPPATGLKLQPILLCYKLVRTKPRYLHSI